MHGYLRTGYAAEMKHNVFKDAVGELFDEVKSVAKAYLFYAFAHLGIVYGSSYVV